MSVKVTIDLSGAISKFSGQSQARGQYAMANQMLSDMNPFVPKKENTLRSVGMLGSQGESLEWETPYGKAQFYGTNGKAVFKKYSTPGTGPRWDLKAKGIHMEDWKQAYLKGVGI